MSRADLIAQLRGIVGPRHVMTGRDTVGRYLRGFRFGAGPALAVVRPGSLVEQWRVLSACVAADVIIIMQAANTGLTGGSVPNGTYDRDVVVINTMRLRGIRLIADGKQVICMPGATLDELERVLKPFGREPHSVIGSSCIGASVMGGVCNNSGGALVRRGPVYTELALYARVDDAGRLHLVNHLDIDLPDDPESALAAIEAGDFCDADIRHVEGRSASDGNYAEHVRRFDLPTPARYNADPRLLHQASGCAGRLGVFAVRLDTFEAENETAVFYIGTNDTAELADLRRRILGDFSSLPIAAEYIHRTAYDIAATYGKDTFLAIDWLGTSRLPRFFALKARIDALAARLPGVGIGLTDRVLQRLSRLFPRHLPRRMDAFRDRYEHHLLLRMGGAGIAEARRHLSAIFPSSSGDYFECEADEGAKAFLHRFAVAGAAVRYRLVHMADVEDIVALDFALPRNESDWFERLPTNIESGLLHKLYYGHFLCHVFHQDYIVAKGVDPHELEHRMLALLDQRRAEYPAEHNVGHLYKAKPALEEFYRKLDPLNQFNPGIGGTPRGKYWRHDRAQDADGAWLE